MNSSSIVGAPNFVQPVPVVADGPLDLYCNYQMIKLILATLLSFACGHIILVPSKAGPEASLIIFQGATVAATEYVKIGKQIQDAYPGSLYVGIPEFAFGLSLPPAVPLMKGKFDEMRVQLKAAGASDSSPLFAAGHSLGGIAMQEFAKANPTIFSGLVFLGSSVTRGNEQAITLPTLTVNGQYDGLFHSMRTAESYFKNKQGNFVVLIRGLTHMGFATFENIPFLPKMYDFQSPISLQEAHQKISKVVSSFLISKTNLDETTKSDALQILQNAMADTGVFLQPHLESLRLEANNYLYPPCNSDTPSLSCPYYASFPNQDAKPVSTDSTPCACGIPFAAQAQKVIANLDETKYLLESRDAQHPVSEIKPVHLPHIWNDCLTAESLCTLNATTVTENVYDKANAWFDSGNTVSANEIRMKLKSRQSFNFVTTDIYAADKDVKISDPNTLCRQVNEHSYKVGLSLVAPDVLEFYLKNGVKYVFGDDAEPAIPAGPLWIGAGLKYINQANSQGEPEVQIVSTGFVTALKPPLNVQNIKGFHYCKVLSPARVVEWVYTDSLRNKIGLKSPVFNW